LHTTEHGSAPSSSSSTTPAISHAASSPTLLAWLRSRPLAVTNATYALLYAVDGALLPFLSVFLAYEHGFSASQIGMVLAASSVAGLMAPPILTMLADRHGRAELLFIWVLVASAATLLVFSVVEGYWWLLVVYTAFCLAREPSRPLLDGIFFAAQRRIPALADVSYHRVRIWGTVGYMIPGILLYISLTDDSSLDVLPVIACGLALLGIVVAWFLPTRHVGRTAGSPPSGSGTDQAVRSRSRAGHGGGTSLSEVVRVAGRLLRRPTTVTFLASMFLLQVGQSVYFAFYPLLATDVVGLAPRWLGLVTNVGVIIELAYMAGYGWLVRRLGWRWLMVLGSLAAVARFALLAASPSVAVIVGTQVVHGLVIIGTMVAGRVILDMQAPDEIRHTAQGIYAIVLGGGRMAGAAAGGLIAAASLAAVFWCAAAVGLLAALGMAWALRDEPKPV